MTARGPLPCFIAENRAQPPPISDGLLLLFLVLLLGHLRGLRFRLGVLLDAGRHRTRCLGFLQQRVQTLAGNPCCLLARQGQLTSVAAAGVEEGVHDKDRPSPHVYGFC